jgi:hypothetical protein
MINNTKFNINFPIIFLGILIILPFVGIILNYSSIPEADFWSIFERIYKFDQGNWTALIDQHNEHRPALSYLVSYFDNKFFGGRFYLNYIVTVISFILTALLIYVIFKDHVNEDYLNKIYFGLMICLLFFWAQRPNFIYPFHISILWVNLFTLLSLFFFNRFVITEKNTYFYFSILISFLPIFSMVSGIFTFPILTMFALVKKRKFEFALLLILSLFTCFFYFYDFTFVSNHSNFFELNLKKLINIYLYFFGYLGSIFSFMFGKGMFGFFISIIGGHVFILLYFMKLKEAVLNKFNSKSDYLLYFILLILISGFLTAIGRFEDGIMHSISSRYTTNTIFGWVIMMILYHSSLKKYFFIYDKEKRLIKFKFLLFLYLILISHNQLKAIKVDYDSQKILSRSEGLIALSLGINSDYSKIPHLNTTNINQYLEDKLFIFKRNIFETLHDIQNKNLLNRLKSDDLLNLNIDIKRNFNYSRISFSTDKIQSDKVYFKNNEGVVMGYAISNNYFSFMEKKKKTFIGYFITGMSDDEFSIYY